MYGLDVWPPLTCLRLDASRRCIWTVRLSDVNAHLEQIRRRHYTISGHSGTHFVYLAAMMDWHSRKVLAWRVSVTMDTGFCVEALEESLGRHGAPEIFNTDQGSS